MIIYGYIYIYIYDMFFLCKSFPHDFFPCAHHHAFKNCAGDGHCAVRGAVPAHRNALAGAAVEMGRVEVDPRFSGI